VSLRKQPLGDAYRGVKPPPPPPVTDARVRIAMLEAAVRELREALLGGLYQDCEGRWFRYAQPNCQSVLEFSHACQDAAITNALAARTSWCRSSHEH
jgi:hypothetical protein